MVLHHLCLLLLLLRELRLHLMPEPLDFRAEFSSTARSRRRLLLLLLLLPWLLPSLLLPWLLLWLLPSLLLLPWLLPWLLPSLLLVLLLVLLLLWRLLLVIALLFFRFLFQPQLLLVTAVILVVVVSFFPSCSCLLEAADPSADQPTLMGWTNRPASGPLRPLRRHGWLSRLRRRSYLISALARLPNGSNEVVQLDEKHLKHVLN